MYYSLSGRVAFSAVAVLVFLLSAFSFSYAFADNISNLTFEPDIQGTVAGAKIALSPEPSDDYGTGETVTSLYCPQLSTTIKKGARGTQVSELQAFLTSYYDLDENIVTGGYFGNITHRYVVKFQQQHGLPAFGIVGSLSRVKIVQVCEGVILNPVSFNASPSTGPAPLVVNFQGSGSGLTAGAFISFGDGTNSNEGSVSTGHTYQYPGTYTAALHKDGAKGEIVARTTVTVHSAPSKESCSFKAHDGNISTSGQQGLGSQNACVSWCTSIRAEKYGTQYSGICRYTSPNGPYTEIQLGGSETPLNVHVSLEDPTGNGKESFVFGDQVVIKWTATPSADLELNGWGIGSHSDTGIELRPVGNESAAGTRIVRVKETGTFPHTYTWNVTRAGLYGDIVTPGRYYVYVNVASQKQGGYRTGVAGPIAIGQSIGFPPSPTAAPTVSLTADGQSTKTIHFGEEYTMNFSSSNVSNCTMSYQGTGPHASLQGSYPLAQHQINIATRTESKSGLIGSYTLTCTGTNGAQVANSISIFAPHRAAVTFTVNGKESGTSLVNGEAFSIEWNSSNAVSCTIKNSQGETGPTAANTSGTSLGVFSGNTLMYTFTCTGSDGQPVSKTLTITSKTASLQNSQMNQLANALTALEAILKTLQGKFTQ